MAIIMARTEFSVIRVDNKVMTFDRNGRNLMLNAIIITNNVVNTVNDNCLRFELSCIFEKKEKSDGEGDVLLTENKTNTE